MLERLFSGPSWRDREVLAAHAEALRTKDECIEQMKSIQEHLIVQFKEVAQVFVEQNTVLLDRHLATCDRLVDFEMSRKEVGKDYGTMLNGDKAEKEAMAQKDRILKELEEAELAEIARQYKGAEHAAKVGALPIDI